MAGLKPAALPCPLFRLGVLGVLVCGALLSFYLALSLGSLSLEGFSVWQLLWGTPTKAPPSVQALRDVLLGLRFPRALAAFACGGLLALAGALMQTLLRNPLADPYILGVSGGAAIGALGALSLGLSALWVDAGAFIGALGITGLVFGLAGQDHSHGQTRLLLTGVVVASGCGAGITLMLSLARERELKPMLFWLMGDVSGAGTPWPAFVILCLALVALWPWARDLHVLSRGPLHASALGVNVPALRLGLYGVSSLLTALAVTTVGSVGFVGLVVPHLIRLMLGNDPRILLPAVALAGGSLLLLADTAARTVMAPVQLPVGVLTAFIGVPLFLFLLLRQAHERD
jgi:iron complex transport system permease protein